MPGIYSSAWTTARASQIFEFLLESGDSGLEIGHVIGEREDCAVDPDDLAFAGEQLVQLRKQALCADRCGETKIV